MWLKRIILISHIVLIIIISHSTYAFADIRGVVKKTPDLSHQSGKIGAYRALIIGIQNYDDPKIPDLTTPLNDAKALAGCLLFAGFDAIQMRVPELLAARINVSLGHDDVMDPWYPMGTHDMLEVAHMGAHALHMTGVDQQAALFDAITVNGAKTLNLGNYGLEPGCNADMVILQASSKQEAIRLHPARLFVIRRGKVISRMAKAQATVNTGAEDVTVDFCP